MKLKLEKAQGTKKVNKESTLKLTKLSRLVDTQTHPDEHTHAHSQSHTHTNPCTQTYAVIDTAHKHALGRDMELHVGQRAS